MKKREKNKKEGNINLKKEKKAVSSIIVTVLLILIVIIAIAVVAVFVMKMVRDNTQEIATPSISISVISSNTKPFYNSQELLLFVAVERGSDNANLSKIMFIVTTESGSETFTNNIVPSSGEKLYYNIRPENQNIKTLEIAPIIKLNNGKEKTLSVVDRIDITTLLSGCDQCTKTDGGWMKFSGTPSNPLTP